MDQDIEDLYKNPIKPQRKTKKEFELLFDPTECWKQLKDKDLESNQLDQSEKQELGEKMDERRRMLRDRATKTLNRSAV